MERIKQALDKARAERSQQGEGPQVVAGKAAQEAEGGRDRTAEHNFKYSQTAVKSLDRKRLAANRIIIDESNSAGLTAYKMLRTQILQRMTAKGWNALAITSPAPEDGKTVTAINLAISLARELHHTVLLVDMDLRNPSIHKYLELNPEKGISDILLRNESMSAALINPGIERLVILPGREAISNSSEFLAAPVMGHLVQELKTRYPSRFVLFDLPPVLSTDDALSFAPYADAFLMVVRDGKTTQKELQHASEILKNAEIIGTVLNGSEEKISPYY